LAKLAPQLGAEVSKTSALGGNQASAIAQGIKYGAVLATMTGEIALRIANNIELAHRSSVRHWRFPDRGVNNLTVPCHVAWKTDIY
jgi:hypothetical protein